MTLVDSCLPAVPHALPRQHRKANPCAVVPCGPLGDLRYRTLMGTKAWNALKPAVRRRFAKRLGTGDSVVYMGEIVETRMNRLGRILVQAARLIGSPFPLEPEARGEAAVVALTADHGSAGQHWTRLYAWRKGFPQVVHSAKRFAGPTGLEEYVGYGVGVALTLHEEDGGLRFRSAGYFLSLFGRRLPLPALLSPGEMVIGHDDLGSGRFTFTLHLRHPWFGVLLHQVAQFDDTAPTRGKIVSAYGPIGPKEDLPCTPPCSPL